MKLEVREKVLLEVYLVEEVVEHWVSCLARQTLHAVDSMSAPMSLSSRLTYPPQTDQRHEEKVFEGFVLSHPCFLQQYPAIRLIPQMQSVQILQVAAFQSLLQVQ